MRAPTEPQLVKIGESLREIDPSTLQQDEENGPVRWFIGDAGTELFAWLTNEGFAQHVQLVFSRMSVEWSASAGLTTGSFSGTPATSGGRYDPYMLQVASHVDPDVCRAALVMMRAARVGEALFVGFIRALEQATEPEAVAN